MDVTPLIPAGRRIIESYGDGGFRISGARYQGSVIVCADQIVHWRVEAWSEVADHPVAPHLFGPSAIAPGLELVLFGTGAKFTRMDSRLREELRLCGIAAEAMDTGAACRTYNVLMAEGRHVAAALIAVP